ncbi:NADH-quinone oxidoreductase subunit NuoE [Proteinivorax hydrogeniformans]|uniref:NADH-quinone oxidoreductase subunit NuoE n=1 Tax=Proteinivorax hydrogeniformans TaxID=1826727 RepID=A0AAU8HWC9_9FIRM
MEKLNKCCCGNDNQQDEKKVELEKLFAEYKGKKGALIPVLQKAQDIYGYLPKEVIADIADGLNLPVSQVYGVCTFYSQFHLNPRGENIIRVCMGTACHVRGADKVLERLQADLGVEPGETTEDLKFTLESVACIGACGLAPVIMINDNTHGRLDADTVSEVLDKYK